MPIAELEADLAGCDKKIYLAGDGRLPAVHLAAENRRYQRAYGVAAAAEDNKELFRPASELVPVYLRPPQAERELKLRKGVNT